MWRHGKGSEGETDMRIGWPVPFTLPRNMMYPALLPLMRTPRLPVVDWTDALRRFKWTRSFRRKTKSGFCTCAITFQLPSNAVPLQACTDPEGSRRLRFPNSRLSAYEDGKAVSPTRVAFTRQEIPLVEPSWNVMAHGDAREGKWRGNWRMQWVASTFHTTSEHGVSSITTADAHTSAASSRLNWRPPPI